MSKRLHHLSSRLYTCLRTSRCRAMSQFHFHAICLRTILPRTLRHSHAYKCHVHVPCRLATFLHKCLHPHEQECPYRLLDHFPIIHRSVIHQARLAVPFHAFCYSIAVRCRLNHSVRLLVPRNRHYPQNLKQVCYFTTCCLFCLNSTRICRRILSQIPMHHQQLRSELLSTMH
jgi:hypothetical protein